MHKRTNDMFCEDCEKSVCAECAVISGHRKHVIIMKDTIQKQNLEFLKKTEQTIQHLESILNENIKEKKEKIQRDQEVIFEELDDQFNQIINKINNKKQNIISKLNLYFENKENDNKENQNEIINVRLFLEENKNENRSFQDKGKKKEEIVRLLEILKNKSQIMIEENQKDKINLKVRI